MIRTCFLSKKSLKGLTADKIAEIAKDFDIFANNEVVTTIYTEKTFEFEKVKYSTKDESGMDIELVAEESFDPDKKEKTNYSVTVNDRGEIVVAHSKEKVDLWIKRLKGKQNVILFFMFIFFCSAFNIASRIRHFLYYIVQILKKKVVFFLIF